MKNINYLHDESTEFPYSIEFDFSLKDFRGMKSLVRMVGDSLKIQNMVISSELRDFLNKNTNEYLSNFYDTDIPYIKKLIISFKNKDEAIFFKLSWLK